mgnify:CR=1 FL=1
MFGWLFRLFGGSRSRRKVDPPARVHSSTHSDANLLAPAAGPSVLAAPTLVTDTQLPKPSAPAAELSPTPPRAHEAKAEPSVWLAHLPGKILLDIRSDATTWVARASTSMCRRTTAIRTDAWTWAAPASTTSCRGITSTPAAARTRAVRASISSCRTTIGTRGVAPTPRAPISTDISHMPGPSVHCG